MKLRIDPWDPEYGASVELDPELETPAGLDLGVETDGTWEPVAAPTGLPLPCCAFVDGVRRIDARLFAEDGDNEVPALAGSWAAGSARSIRPPVIADIVVGRELVVGGGLDAPDLRADVGNDPLTFTARSVAGTMPLDPLRGLQNAMREAEAHLAQCLLVEPGMDLVISDGPLNFFTTGPAVGMVKRQSRSYLDADRSNVLAALGVGDRSPIFKFGRGGYERYSWYLRLAARRRIDGTMAGIVRLEVATTDGLDAARRLADLAGAALPRFAPSPARDPRAPQNLYPIGALERALGHRLGDRALVRRAIEVTIHREVLLAERP